MKLNRFLIIFTVLCLFCLLTFGTALADISVDSTEKKSNSGTGSATIVDLSEEKQEESKPIVNQNDEKSVESNIDEEKPIVSEQEHEKFPAVILLLLTVLATAIFILMMIQKGAEE